MKKVTQKKIEKCKKNEKSKMKNSYEYFQKRCKWEKKIKNVKKNLKMYEMKSKKNE